MRIDSCALALKAGHGSKGYRLQVLVAGDHKGSVLSRKRSYGSVKNLL
jgi:hypothetical protein